MSRSDSRRSGRRTSAPVRVVSERVSPDELPDPSGPGSSGWADPAVPRIRPAGARPSVAAVDEGWGPAPASWHPPAPVRTGPPTGPVPVLGDDHPSGPLTLRVSDGAALPVLAPRPIRSRLGMLLRLVIRPRRGGRHRSDAPHLKAWSMFEPHRNHPRRGRGAA